MRLADALFTVVVLVLTVSLACILFLPSVQDFMSGNNMWNGIKEFSAEHDAVVVEGGNHISESPGKTALIIIAYKPLGEAELSEIKRFLETGGVVLLMDDYGYGNDVLEFLGLDIRFAGQPLLDPLFCYKNQWLPKVTDLAPELNESGINTLVLNHATALLNTGGAEVLAWSSPTSFLDVNGNEKQDGELQGPLPIIARLAAGKGTLAAIADPSIIINSMVDRDDNSRLIKYLTTEYGEQRQILIDAAHLAQKPLDASKTSLSRVREALSMPYPLLGVIGLIFVVISRYVLKRGEGIGR